MSRHSEYDAYRYLSSSKAGKVAPPKSKPKSLLVGTVLTWMLCAVVVAVAFHIFHSLA